MVESTGCGLLVDPRDSGSIANAISYVLAHDDEAEAMGQRGRAAVQEHLNWLVEERKLLAFYSAIAAHPSARSEAAEAHTAGLRFQSKPDQKNF